MLLTLLAAMAMAGEPAAAPAAAPEPAAANAAPGQPAVVKPANAKDKLICKTEAQLGSKFPKRVCRTQEQIDMMRDDSRKAVQDIQFNNHTFPKS